MKLKITSPTVGKVEAVGSITGFKRSGDYVLVSTVTTQPQGWDSEIALDHRDLTRVLWLVAKSSLPLFLLTGLKSRNSPRPLPRRW
jgi:hypothetical protein